MTKLTKISLVIISIALAVGATFAIQPKTLGTSTRTKTVYLDRENNFTATTTLQKGFVSTSTPTQAGQIVGLDEDGKLPAVDGSQLTNLPNTYSTIYFLANQVDQYKHYTTGPLLVPFAGQVVSQTVWETDNSGATYTTTIKVNGVEKTLPTNIVAGDLISVKIDGTGGSYDAHINIAVLIKAN